MTRSIAVTEKAGYMRSLRRLAAVISVRSLVGEINAWQAGADRIHAAGIDASTFVDNAKLTNGGALGRCAISTIPASWIRQDGYIRQVKFQIRTPNAGIMKFKVFRPVDTNNYAFVSESEQLAFPLSTDIQTYTLAQPMACQVGDVLGVWWKDTAALEVALALKTKAATANSVRYVDSDPTSGTTTFSTTVSNYELLLQYLANPPYLVATGDSIAEGHNVTVGFHSFYHEGIAGPQAHEIWNQLRGIIGDGSLLQYQNHAMSGQTFAWVASTGIVSAVATKAKAVVIHCGSNDVLTGRAWAAVEADLNTIKAALLPTQKLYLDEILPRTASNDALAAAARTFNANLATWCAANGARLIVCHDEMGQVRVSTGEKDDLLTAYDEDGTHLTQAGVDMMAALVRRYL
jgi:lysophospholipase L1-like esterase